MEKGRKKPNFDWKDEGLIPGDKPWIQGGSSWWAVEAVPFIGKTSLRRVWMAAAHGLVGRRELKGEMFLTRSGSDLHWFPCLNILSLGFLSHLCDSVLLTLKAGVLEIRWNNEASEWKVLFWFFCKVDLYFQACILIMGCSQCNGDVSRLWPSQGSCLHLPMTTHMISLDKSSRYMTLSFFTYEKAL